jgi:hypothetical protein
VQITACLNISQTEVVNFVFLRSLKSFEMQRKEFSIALLGKQSLLCLPNKDKVTSLLKIFLIEFKFRYSVSSISFYRSLEKGPKVDISI